MDTHKISCKGNILKDGNSVYNLPQGCGGGYVYFGTNATCCKFGSIIRSVIYRYNPGINIDIRFEPARASPRGIGRSDEKIKIIAKVTDSGGTPLSSKGVRFSVQAAANSGGHNHNSNKPVGSFSNNACVTGLNGECSVDYTASLFGGTDKITAETEGVKAEGGLEVNALDIETAPPSPLRLLPDGLYIKNGQTTIHPENHFGTFRTISNIQTIALAMSLQGLPQLEVNDISLSYGGGFDVGGNWGGDLCPKPCKGHQEHRKGNQADIQVKPDTYPAKLPPSKLRSLGAILTLNGDPRIWPEPDRAHWHLTFR